MFLADAHDIMQHLVNTQQDVNSWTDDDPQISYMISAWARMCQILGEEFHQYLPIVMGPLMRAASFKEEISKIILLVDVLIKGRHRDGTGIPPNLKIVKTIRLRSCLTLFIKIDPLGIPEKLITIAIHMVNFRTFTEM